METLYVSDSYSVHYHEFFYCTRSNDTRHIGLLTAREQDKDGTAWSCSRAVWKPVWRILLLFVQWKSSWWCTEELSETCRFSFQNKFEKLVHLFGFIIRNLSRGTVTCTSQSLTSVTHSSSLHIIVLLFDGLELKFDLMMTMWSTQGCPKFRVHGALGHYSTLCVILRTRRNTRQNNMLLYSSPVEQTAAVTFAKVNAELRKVFTLWSGGSRSLLGFSSSITGVTLEHNLENNPINKRKKTFTSVKMSRRIS